MYFHALLGGERSSEATQALSLSAKHPPFILQEVDMRSFLLERPIRRI